MELFVHNKKNVVVKKGVEQNGMVEVSYVGKSADVVGAKRRGRTPSYKTPVPVTDLVQLTDPSENMVKRAQLVLGQANTESGE
jgi:hypothetical protein